MILYPEIRFHLLCSCVGCDEGYLGNEAGLHCRGCQIAQCEYQGFCVRRRMLYDLATKQHKFKVFDSHCEHPNSQRRFTVTCQCGVTGKEVNLTMQQCRKRHARHLDLVFERYLDSHDNTQMNRSMRENALV